MAEEQTSPNTDIAEKSTQSTAQNAKATADAAAKELTAKGPTAKGPTAKGPVEKKAKPSAVEDKPFAEFIQEYYIPELQKAFEAQDIRDCAITFDQNQVSGSWQKGQRQFTVYFPEENINAQRAFSCATTLGMPFTIEPFLIDERKMTLDLLVFGVMQRLNAQKWLGAN